MSQEKLFQTDFLFPTPTKLQGLGTVFNIWGQYHVFNNSQTGEEADARAIRSDWGVTGQDLQFVLEKLEEGLRLAS
jgi:hypothetical protein